MAENLAKVVTAENITKALEEIISTKPSLIPSTKFDLVHKGMRFPPKEVIRRAAQIQNIHNWQDYRLSGGESSSRHLRAKGFDIQPKSNAVNLKYFVGGAAWGPNDQTKRFIEGGFWENGFDDKFIDEVKDIPQGSMFAIKSAFAKGKDSYLRIKCIGEVVHNPGTGKTLAINWERDFEPFDLLGLGGYYMKTLHEVTNPAHIDAIFDHEEDAANNKVVTNNQTPATLNLNTILYGPPGTGKTFNTIDKALQIVAPEVYEQFRNDRAELTKRFRELLITDWANPKGQIAFVTFHQNMSYEDFIEGIKPVKPEASNTIHYDIIDGIFKRMCQEASRSKEHIVVIDGIQKPLTRELFEELYYTFSETLPPHTDATSPLLLQTKEGYPFELFRNSAGSIVVKAGEKRTGQSVAHSELQAVLFEEKPPTYKSYESIIISKILEGKSYKRSPVDNSTKSFVLVIDEINRGNVAQIFGELITLIEPSKRKGADEALEAILPYSKKPFSVPKNLYIIGTMNTADRSVEALDTALRRRFSFEEMMPDPAQLSTTADGIDLPKLITAINDRLETLIDRDHTIGHAWLIGCKYAADVKKAFQDKIIPLLKEFFYNDYSKIGLVLGDAFVTKGTNKKANLFAPFTGLDSETKQELYEKPIYRISMPENGNMIKAFQSIYQANQPVNAEANQGI